MTRLIDGKFGDQKTYVITSWTLFLTALVPLIVISALISTHRLHRLDAIYPLSVLTGLMLFAGFFFTFLYHNTPPQPDYAYLVNKKKTKWFDNEV